MVHIDIGQYRTDDVSLRAPRFICLIFPILQSSRFQVCAGLPSAIITCFFGTTPASDCLWSV